MYISSLPLTNLLIQRKSFKLLNLPHAVTLVSFAVFISHPVTLRYFRLVLFAITTTTLSSTAPDNTIFLRLSDVKDVRFIIASNIMFFALSDITQLEISNDLTDLLLLIRDKSC